MNGCHSNTKTYKLNTGANIPAVGLGTWKSTEEECYNAVKTALQNGYFHIDTARIYGNEESVGKAINDYLTESGTPREKLFITTKLWCSECQEPEKSLKESLARLNLDYVDLYLTHWPVAIPPGGELMPLDADGARLSIPFDEWNYVDTYKGMQKLIKTGLTKAIGVSNYNIPKLEKLLNDPGVTIVPAANQVEMHPLLPQNDLVKYCKEKGIMVECYSPLGSTGAPVLQNETLLKHAQEADVSPATLAISWSVARGNVVLPKSVHPGRIISNIKTIDLSPTVVEELEAIGEKNPHRVGNPKWAIKINLFEDSAEY